MDSFLLVFIIIITYILLLFLIKKIGFGKKINCDNCNNCCPDCNNGLKRVQRKKSDHIFHHLSFRIFDSRRYVCDNCGWEGLRWEDRFKKRIS